MFLFTIGIPAVFIYFTRLSVSCDEEEKLEVYRGCYGFLYSPFTEGNSYWNTYAILGRKLLVVSISALFERDSVLIPFCLFLILCLSFGLHLWYIPFKEKFDNKLEGSLLLVASVSYFGHITTYLRGASGSSQFNNIILLVNLAVGLIVGVLLIVRTLSKQLPVISDWLQKSSITKKESSDGESIGDKLLVETESSD